MSKYNQNAQNQYTQTSRPSITGQSDTLSNDLFWHRPNQMEINKLLLSMCAVDRLIDVFILASIELDCAWLDLCVHGVRARAFAECWCARVWPLCDDISNSQLTAKNTNSGMRAGWASAGDVIGFNASTKRNAEKSDFRSQPAPFHRTAVQTKTPPFSPGSLPLR